MARISSDSDAWIIRPLAEGDRAAVGRVVAAAFAAKYTPALGADPELAAAVAAVVPRGVASYVGGRHGVIYGAGWLRFHGQPGFGSGETGEIWRLLRARQPLLRATRSMLLLSLLGADGSPDRASGYISSLAVHPDQQGQGLGRALLAHLESAARAAGKARLTLHVVDTNAGARRLYEQYGFRAVRSEPAFFTRRTWGYGALVYMVKPLS